MTDDFIRIVPQDPRFVPPAERHEAALAALRRFVPEADQIQISVSDEIRFVHAGVNFERAHCPNCGADLTDWWGDAMDIAYTSRFEELELTVPCCGRW